MRWITLVRMCTLLQFLVLGTGNEVIDPMDSMVAAMEEDGYYRREHSLVQPYQGSGMDIPYWEFGGSTVVTSNYVRLTPDRQSKKGMLWNTMPIRMHNWEVLLHFAVHGQAKHLFGDGFAVWYTKERGQLGPVMGNKDYFTGLGIIFDTYSNHNGEHAHDHPYISGVINNGTLHYDHDRDGTHSQVSGCSVQFRNSKDETYVAISYVNRLLTVLTNINAQNQWESCFSVSDIDLPTGYYFGVTAATGDLADNHDVISLRLYDVDSSQDVQVQDGTAAENLDWSTVLPHAVNAEPPRAHVDDIKPLFGPVTYQAISIGLIILLIIGIVVVVGGVAIVNTKDKNRKRFF